jgi:hypothetical protein
MAGDRARSAERAAEHAAERRKADADAVAGVKTETALDLQVGQDAPALAPPTPKFPHHGKHLKRWEYLLHALRVRGWVVRPAAGEAVVDVADGVPTLMQRWVWVGREGEAAVREQEAASQAQVETEAADKGPENEAHAPQSDLDLLTRHAAEVQPEEKAHKLGKKAWRRSKSLARTAGKDTGADKTGHDETEE